eukprot:m51a1_g14767 putative rho gtpase-activating protein 1 (476) ;mRNA; r:371231-373160
MAEKDKDARRKAVVFNTDDLRRLSVIAGLDDDEPVASSAAPAVDAALAALLAKSMAEDLSDLQKLNFLYTSGFDAEGRTIVVFVGCNMPARTVSLDRVFLFILRTMDKVVESPYVLVYIHANMSSANRPSFGWMRRVYGLFNRKYKKNLKHLYVVRPTTWLKMVFGLFRPFLSQKFWRKLTYVESLTGIWDYLSPQQLHLPASVVRMETQMQPLFGESLESVLANPSNRNCRVPIVVNDCIGYCMDNALETEGLLRVTGDRAVISELRMAYDAGQLVDITPCLDPHSIAGLLKMFLRELPVPLLTYDLFDPLLVPMQDPSLNDDQRCAAVKDVLTRLPEPNKLLLWHICLFAYELSRHSAVNKMTVENISVCLGPTLIWRRPEDIDPASALSEMGYVNMLVRLLISRWNEALPLPANLPSPHSPTKRHSPPARPPPVPPPRQQQQQQRGTEGLPPPPSMSPPMPPPPSGPAPIPR